MKALAFIVASAVSVATTAVPKQASKDGIQWSGKGYEWEAWQVTPIGDRLPKGAPNTTLDKRDSNFCVYVCMDINWSGDCQDICTPLNTCFEVAPCKTNTISSFGPESPGPTCYAYRNNVCYDDGTWQFTYPGGSDGGLSWNNGNPWNDAINSWVCA